MFNARPYNAFTFGGPTAFAPLPVIGITIPVTIEAFTSVDPSLTIEVATDAR